MSSPSVGQIEKRTQARVVALFRDRLGYDYLSNWIDREGMCSLAALFKHLCDRNRAVYELLHFIAEEAELGEHREAILAVTIPRAPGQLPEVLRHAGRAQPESRSTRDPQPH